MDIGKVDRAIYEILRLKVVELGYLPDITAYASAADYKQARETLKNSLPDGKLIDVYGVGAAYPRGELHVNRFTIDRKIMTIGSVGTPAVTQHEAFNDGGEIKYRRLAYPDTMSDITYEIRTVTDTVQYERFLQSIIRTVLGFKRSIKPVDEAGVFLDRDLINIISVNAVNVSGTDNLIEWLFTYQVKDAWIGELEELRQVVPLTSVDFAFYDIRTEDELYKTENFD